MDDILEDKMEDFINVDIEVTNGLYIIQLFDFESANIKQNIDHELLTVMY